LSLNQFNQALKINIEPSLHKRLLIILSHLFISIVLVCITILSKLNILYLFVSLSCIFISFFYFVRLHINKSLKSSVLKVEKRANDYWMLTIKDEIQVKAVTTGANFISNHLILLNFKDQNKNSYIVFITPDSVSKESFRKLKVMIKTNKSQVDIL